MDNLEFTPEELKEMDKEEIKNLVSKYKDTSFFLMDNIDVAKHKILSLEKIVFKLVDLL
jgi:hypothetical protein